MYHVSWFYVIVILYYNPLRTQLFAHVSSLWWRRLETARLRHGFRPAVSRHLTRTRFQPIHKNESLAKFANVNAYSTILSYTVLSSAETCKGFFSLMFLSLIPHFSRLESLSETNSRSSQQMPTANCYKKWTAPHPHQIDLAKTMGPSHALRGAPPQHPYPGCDHPAVDKDLRHSAPGQPGDRCGQGHPDGTFPRPNRC